MEYGMVPGLFYASVLAFGLIVGSFLNVVVHRVPLGLSIVSPRSRCPRCETQIAARDNVPILSWLILRGACRHCGARISPRYPLVELLTGVLFVLMAWRFGPTVEALLFMVFCAGLVVAAAVDIDHQIIPDEISLGGLGFGLLVVPAVHALSGASYRAALTESALGALVGGGSLWIVAFVHARISVATGRRFAHWPGEGESVPRPSEADYWLWFPGLGLGDVKLLAMIGAFVGPWGVLDTILIASLIGLCSGVAWAIVRHSWDSPFGFGPAIAAGAILSLLLPRHLVGLAL
jgi:leader peptidase (prepilin peptidase)/N-methyltransferase